MDKIKNKQGQEEMIGFAVIIIIVAVILVIFLGFTLNNESEGVQSYEVESFLQASLQYTTSCEDNFGYLSLQDLIFKCENKESCFEEDSCNILENELKGILEKSWIVEKNSLTKGYELNITSNGKEMIFVNEGNSTSNSKGAYQSFFRMGNSIDIHLTVYN